MTTLEQEAEVSSLMESLRGDYEMMRPKIDRLEKLLFNWGGEGTNNSAKTVVREVAKYYRIPVMQVIGKDRHMEIVKARHTAIYILRTVLRLTHHEIGLVMGNRDHGSSIWGIRNVEQQMKQRPAYRQQVETIIKVVVAALTPEPQPK